MFAHTLNVLKSSEASILSLHILGGGGQRKMDIFCLVTEAPCTYGKIQ